MTVPDEANGSPSADATSVHECVLDAPFPDADIAASVAAALELDAGDVEGDRSKATVHRDGARVRIAIEADDPSALRAAKRTWCNGLDAAERTALVADGERS